MRISKEKQEETKRLYELENAIMRLKKEKDAGKDIDEFHDLFGYQKISDCIKAFEGCKKAYQDVKEFFTPREISYLRRKMEREGC